MVNDSSSLKAKVIRDSSRESRFRNLPSKRQGYNQSSSSQESNDIRQKLKDKGYVETYNPSSEEFVYSSPSEEFISYQDKKLQQKSNYSSDVVVTDASGRILREERYAPGLVEAYGSTTIREAKLVEKNIYDYTKGEISTEIFDSTNRNTILASTQIVENQISRGERTSEPLVVTQRRETEQLANRVREQNQGYKRFQTTDGKLGAITGNIQIFSGSKKEREQYLNNPVTYNTKKRIQDAQKRSEELNDLGYTKASDIFNGKTKASTINNSNNFFGDVSNRSKSSMGNDSEYSNLDLRNSKLSSLEQEKAFEKRAESINQFQQDISNRAERTKDFFRIIPGLKGDNYVQKATRYTLALPALLPLTTFENLKLASDKAQFQIEALLNPNYRESAKKESLRSLKQTPTEIIRGIDPRNPEGFVNLATLFIPIKFKSPKVALADDFLKTLNKEKPSTIRGDTYYGQDIVESVRKGDVIRSTPEMTVELPKSSIVESRIVGTPKEVLTVAGGKNINIVSTPDGLQITTTKGSGKYKDYFVRTTTNPLGESISKTFRIVEIKNTFVDKITGFARGKNQYNLDYDLQLLKVTKTKAPQGIKFTEAVNVFDNTNDLVLEGYTQRVKSTLEQRKGIPLTRKGYVPIGSDLTSARELVQVGQKIPKTDFIFRDNVLSVDTYKTEFNIVDYPVPIEKTFFRRTNEEAIGIKPVEFVTQAEVLLKRSFEIRFEKLGKVQRPNVRVPRQIEEQSLFSKSDFYPSKAEEVFESFKGKQADIFGLQDASLSRQLERNDPFGVSGDRLRNNLVEQTQRLDVQRPKINYKLSDKTIYTGFSELGSLKSLRGLGLLKNPLSNTQPRIRNETINMNKLDLFNESKLNLNSKSFLKNNLLINNRVVTENIVDNKLINDMRTLIKTESLLKTNTQTRTRTNTQTKNSRSSLPFSIPRFDNLMNIRESFDFERNKMNKTDVYDTYVYEARAKNSKRGTTRVKVSSKLPRNKALNEGAYYADNSQSRRFTIKKSGKVTDVEDDPFFDLDYKFRSPKGKSKLPSNSFIEKNTYTLDSQGEFNDITARGLLALRKKGVLSFF